MGQDQPLRPYVRPEVKAVHKPAPPPEVDRHQRRAERKQQREAVIQDALKGVLVDPVFK